MTQSKDDNDIVILTGSSDPYDITFDDMATTTTISTDTISTDSFTITDGDYVFNLDDTINIDSIVSGSTVSTGFGTEWIDHLPAMSVVKDMCLRIYFRYPSTIIFSSLFFSFLFFSFLFFSSHLIS